MELTRHGLNIGLERSGDQFYLSLKVSGKLTHEDYQSMTPMLEAALAEITSPKVNAFIDAVELEGWEPRAVWDDFKLALKHGNEFEKIAIYGYKKWQSVAARLSSWFISGEVKFFDDPKQALQWLNQ
ncbi:STAS/SEC14 domain-containing protein [Methylophaga sp. OBS1]|uniref:STAS/SEC14 domain-containing protein n=1 Tax=Methylophaga sp. OBS1 TaxID=2991933 RepID=UPI002253456C|nr:STAS/SEC14 domain-containing protein [Methylophaga sp. OBS1]MCX4192884.1 STAS/SEC14 domain-containing protein [Methylophaga sp. OBS1]